MRMCVFPLVTILWLACSVEARSAGGKAVEAWEKKVTHRYFADRRKGIRLDGDLSEWDFTRGAVRIDVGTAHQQPGPVRSKADSSAVVAFGWDSQYLYVAARVRDQSLRPLARKTDMPWTCDSLMFVVTTFGATRASDRYHQVKNVATSAEPFFGFSYYTEATGPRQWTEHSRYVARKTADGYAIEAAVSLADVGYRPRAGDRLKMAFVLPDHDADGKFSQLILGSPQRIVTSPVSYWLDLRFRGKAGWAGDVVPAQARATDTADVRFVGEVDAFKPGLKLKRVELRTRDGNTLAALPVDRLLVPGTTMCIAGTFAQPHLAPGQYAVALAVEEGGKVKTDPNPAPFEIIASREAEHGVTGKLPDRYIVPDPYRMAFPSKRFGYAERKITKADYIKLIRRVYDAEYPSIYSKGRKANAGHHGFSYAMAPLALYKHSGDVKYLEAVLGLMKGAYESAKKGQTTPTWLEQYEIVQLLLNDPKVPRADKKWLREVYPAIVRAVWKASRPTEWGAFNRALLWGGLLEMGAKVLPDAPDVAAWKKYAELEWQSWWPYRDHDENSSDYNSSSMMDYLDWAAFRNPKLLKDPGLAKWLQRYMLQVTPSGGFPGYGDASPWNGSCYKWIPVFERMATITRDGRFKWAAHRLFEYAERQMEDLFSYHMVYDGAAAGCAWAYIYADETVAEVAPTMKSRVLVRKKVSIVGKAFRKEMFDKHGITGLYYKLSHSKQPDKLLLRAGADPFAPCGMIELCSHAGHHMSSVPNFNNFMHMRAVLLTDLGYFEKGPEYHNVVYIEDLSGIAPEVPSEEVSVPEMVTAATCTYAAVKVENYKEWPVTNDRRVLFTHSGLTLVKDLVTFHKPFVCRVRQQWQTRNVSPESGPNWTNVNIPFLLRSGLGLGRGVQKWKNPSWDLLIYFTPHAGRDYEVFDRSRENPWQAVPLRVSQRYRGLPAKGETLHFTTLLWPHKPVLDVQKYAERVTVLVDTPTVTVFKVAFDKKRTIYLGINDTGRRQKAGDIATDARVFLFECDPSGKPISLFAEGVTRFAVGGKDVHKSTEKARVDQRY